MDAAGRYESIILKRNRRSGRIDPEQEGRTPILPIVALVAAILAIIALAVFNLNKGGDRSVDTGRQPGKVETPASTPTVPTFDVVRISRGGTGVLAGRAAPDSLVEVLVDDQKVGEVRADRNGEWVMILEEPLAPGTAELSLRASRDDEEPVDSGDIVVVSIPEPLVPDRFAEREGEGVVAVLTPRDGDGASKVLQKPGLAAPGEIGDSLAVDTIDFGADGETIIAGRGIPRSTVRLYLDNRFLGENRASDEGAWQVALAEPLPSGQQELRVDQVLGGEGNVHLRILQPFDSALALDPSLAESRVVVQPGNTLWAISRKLYGRGTRFTLIFQENSEQIVDPDLIYPGQLFKLPAQSGQAAESDGS